MTGNSWKLKPFYGEEKQLRHKKLLLPILKVELKDKKQLKLSKVLKVLSLRSERLKNN